MNANKLIFDILKHRQFEIKKPFSGNPLAKKIRDDLPNALKKIINKDYIIKGSAGAGNWANVPWVSILNPRITSTTQNHNISAKKKFCILSNLMKNNKISHIPPIIEDDQIVTDPKQKS